MRTGARIDFLAILAHELRNPLAPIRSAIAILQRHGSDDPMLVKMREVIDRQVQHMTRLIDDLLEVSRITQGKFDLKLRACRRRRGRPPGG